MARRRELAAIGKQWWAENEAFAPEDEVFAARAAREAQLRELFDRWTARYPGMLGVIGA